MMTAACRYHTDRLLTWMLLSVSATLATPVSWGADNPGKRATAAAPSHAETEATPKPPSTNPVAQLICDPAVQADLKLSPRQVSAIEFAYAKIEQPLWLARDAVSVVAAEQKGKLAGSLESEVNLILEPAQQSRLRQLKLQALGWPSLTTPEISGTLDLSTDQKRRIDEITERTLAECRKVDSSTDQAPAREASLTQLRKQEGASIQKLLSIPQRQLLADMVGVTYDLSRVRPLTFTAPQLKQVDAWIGSGPLDISGLRGKVMAFHFWAFGCINCVHNLSHYNDWHQRFADRGLVVLGMHTPETKAERVLTALEDKVREFSICYPVAVDHENQNWTAWANSMWPSVYLIDKRGKVRYWWYGEMNWQGTPGEQFMRQKLEELLAERD
jgi:peroxiredoxin